MEDKKQTQINDCELSDEQLEEVSGGLNIETYLKRPNPYYQIKELEEPKKTLGRSRADSLRNIHGT